MTTLFKRASLTWQGVSKSAPLPPRHCKRCSKRISHENQSGHCADCMDGPYRRHHRQPVSEPVDPNEARRFEVET